MWRGNDDKSASEYLIRPDLFELESASMLRYDLSGKDKKPPFSLTVRLPGNAIPMQKALLTGTYVPISVSPATLVLTPSTVKLLNTITLINKETTGDIDIVVYESSVPSWVSVNPTCGRLRPKEPFHMVLSFDTAAYNEMMQETVNSASSSASPFLSTSSASSSNVLRGLGGSSASISSVLASTLSVGTSTGTNNQGVGKEFQPKLLRGSKSTANVEGLLVIQYMAAGKSVSPSVDTKGEVTLADGTKESVLLQIDKLIIPIAYEVYHEV